MRRLAADVAWSVVVCVFVCCTRPRNLQKRLNRSTSCRSGRGLGWDHVLGGGPDTQFRGLFPPLKCRNEISHGLRKQQTPQQSLVHRRQRSAADDRLPVASELWGQGGYIVPTPSSGLVPPAPPSQRCGLCQNFKQTILTTRLYKVRTNLYPPLTTRSSAIAERPRDASCQLKSCQLPRNSAETTYTTSPDQIDGMKLEI